MVPGQQIDFKTPDDLNVEISDDINRKVYINKYLRKEVKK